MDITKNYSLFTDGILNAVEGFITREGDLSLVVEKPDDSKTIYRITKGKSKGVISFYIKKNGLVSINIQGSPSLNEICGRCCESVIQQTSIPNSLRKSFTIRNSKIDSIELLKLELTDTYNLQVVDKQVAGTGSIKERFDVQTAAGVRVSCTLYENCTFLLQGNVTPLFISVMTESIRWLVVTDQINRVPEVISLQNLTQTFTEDIGVLVPNIDVCGDVDGVVTRMILTSVVLFNSGVIVEDYGCYTFGILKALEGVLKLKLSEDLGPAEKLGDYYYYDQPTHRHRLSTSVYDGVLELKKALNRGYNIWVAYRHSSFHADEQISTSTLLSYEQAYEIFVNSLECINAICENWN